MRFIFELAPLGGKLGDKFIIKIIVIVIMIIITMTDRYNCSDDY